ncbi:MAG: hydrogenase [Burkholderiales bacterium]|nr:hydrogenase [Burkholderiales bacterium]
MPMPMPPGANADPMAYPLIARLFAEHGYARLTAENFAAFTTPPGHALLLFIEDPVRFRETLDLAVIVPELARAFPGRFRVGVLLPEDARREAVRYGFRRWPAVVMLTDGAYVGAIDGLRNWDEYIAAMNLLLRAAPTRPPSVGIAVRGGAEGAGGCHA